MGGSFADRLAGLFRDVSDDGRAFDATWGTETRGFDLGNYEPCRPSVIEATLDAVDLGPQGATFVDLGAGKGRAVLVASQRPWIRSVGIEHRAALVRSAEDNLAAFDARGGSSCPVHFLCSDVATQPLPAGPLVVFLYNPFPPNVLGRVLEALEGRHARLIYVNPRYAPVIYAARWRRVARCSGGREESWRWLIFAPPKDESRSASTGS